MKCIFLCAGYATRMYPLTKDFPKSLLEINGKPLINYLIEDLETKKYIDEYIIISNHKFINVFNLWKKQQKLTNITILDDGTTSNETRLGAVKDIEFVIETLKINDDILVLAGDNLLDFSLNKFIEYFHSKKSNCVMTYIEKEISRLQRTGVAIIDSNDLIVEMEEKPQIPKSCNAIPPFYIFKKDDLNEIANGIKDGCFLDSPGGFVEWFSKKKMVYAFHMPGNRVDIGNLDDYYKINNKPFI